MTMKLTQGTFSFLPELSDEEIRAQIEYALKQGWACSVEHTDDAHPRNVYWDMFGLPMFDLEDAAGAMLEVRRCREAFPGHYIKLNAFASTPGIESPRLSFLVHRPGVETPFALERADSRGRSLRYTTHERRRP